MTETVTTLNRLDVIESLMRQKKLKNYLEIGVANGHIFFRVKSPFKLAVDPAFSFDRLRRIGKALINPANLANQYFEKTSDAFFAEDADRVIGKKPLQLALIDGMHEYQFALRDVENTLRYLSDDGVIILHDCNPLTPGAAVPYDEWVEGQWNGDVWKTILHLRSQRPDLNVFVLDTDQGLGIVTRRKPETVLNFTPAQIDALSYDDLAKNRAHWLNLKSPEYFYTYFGVEK
ncbi:class I SAM-dependent methyltransferase [Larkinella rosea]|uniref:Class I SAM-dependent methyltransferase n=1 Tax=Larkinella rosea TaxID=2025312 RepID=A0A3P1BTS9_9BACT|nr:class I SAM-dependent methyltransferase [Larkinella rosea]RRB04515.1 class I SAM-dependent methyltransferase [Larkinella rosea]